MANTNPLDGNDFVKEGFLKSAIAEMEAFKQKTEDTLNLIETQAVKADQALQGVNTTTAKGKKQISEAEKQAVALSKAREKQNLILNDTEKELQKLKLAQQQQNRLNKLTIKLNEAQEGSYDKLSAQYSINKIQLNAMSAEQRKSTKSGKELETQTNALFEEMKSLQEATGKHTLSVGDYANQIGGLQPDILRTVDAVKSFGTQLWALVANPVGAVIAAISVVVIGLYKAFKRTVVGAELLENATKVLGAVFDTLSTTLTRVISGEQSFIDALTGVTDEMNENINATLKLTKVRRDLERQTAESALAQAELNKEIAALEGIADADSKSMVDREKAAIELTKVQVALSEERLAQAKREQEEQIAALVKTEATQEEVNEALQSGDFATLKSKLNLISVTEDYRTALNELIDSQARVVEAEAEVTRTANESAERLALIRLDQFEQELDLELDLTDKRKSLNEARIADEETTIEERRRLFLENDKIIEDSFQNQMAIYKKYFDVEIDQQKILNSTAAEVSKYAKELRLAERPINRLREIIIDKQQADRDNLETQKQLAIEEEKIRQKRIKESEAELARERAIANERAAQQKDLSLSEIDLLEATEEEKTRLRLKAERDRLQKVLEINRTMGGELSDLQIKQMENTIRAIDQQMEEIGQEQGRVDIYSLMGLKMTEENKAAINQTLGIVKANLMSMVSTRIEAANMLADQAATELDQARENLQHQELLAAQGAESDIEGAKMVLEEKQKINQQAIEEQRKAQAIQRQIDTATQVASMITAAANIFKGFSSIPIVGQVLAVGAIGAMFASFASAKIKARQLSNTQSFGDGGEFDIHGGSHASGNDVSLGVHNGTEMRVEGGEKAAIFSKKAVRKYGSEISNVVKSFNKGVFFDNYSDMFHSSNAMINVLTGVSGGESSDNQMLRQELKELKETFKKEIANIPQPEYFMDENGFAKRMRYKNTTILNQKQNNKHGW